MSEEQKVTEEVNRESKPRDPISECFREIRNNIEVLWAIKEAFHKSIQHGSERRTKQELLEAYKQECGRLCNFEIEDIVVEGKAQ